MLCKSLFSVVIFCNMWNVELFLKQYILFTVTGYGCCIFHLWPFPFDWDLTFFTQRKFYIKKPIFEIRECFDIFDSCVSERRVNDKLFSYYFNTIVITWNTLTFIPWHSWHLWCHVTAMFCVCSRFAIS